MRRDEVELLKGRNRSEAEGRSDLEVDDRGEGDRDHGNENE